jgi:hypothetical protein
VGASVYGAKDIRHQNRTEKDAERLDSELPGTGLVVNAPTTKALDRQTTDAGEMVGLRPDVGVQDPVVAELSIGGRCQMSF